MLVVLRYFLIITISRLWRTLHIGNAHWLQPPAAPVAFVWRIRSRDAYIYICRLLCIQEYLSLYMHISRPYMHILDLINIYIDYIYIYSVLFFLFACLFYDEYMQISCKCMQMYGLLHINAPPNEESRPRFCAAKLI